MGLGPLRRPPSGLCVRRWTRRGRSSRQGACACTLHRRTAPPASNKIGGFPPLLWKACREAGSACSGCRVYPGRTGGPPPRTCRGDHELARADGSAWSWCWYRVGVGLLAPVCRHRWRRTYSVAVISWPALSIRRARRPGGAGAAIDPEWTMVLWRHGRLCRLDDAWKHRP